MSAGDGWCFTPPSARLQITTFSSHPSTFMKTGETDKRWVLEQQRSLAVGRQQDKIQIGVLVLLSLRQGHQQGTVCLAAPSTAPGLLTQTAAVAWNPVPLRACQATALRANLDIKMNAYSKGKERSRWLINSFLMYIPVENQLPWKYSLDHQEDD